MKQFYSYTLICSFFSMLVFISTGCNDWLDVDDLGSLTDEQAYSNENNINAVLNGIYSDMAGNNLYGGHLALSTIEYLGHYYYYPENDPGGNSQGAIQEYYWLGHHNYNEDDIRKRFAAVWEKGYALVFSLNVFIDKVKATEVINQQKKNLLLGEAYGLRAFLHFDLFRLFGPVYEINPEEESIPYNDQPTVTSYGNLPANQFLEKVLADIEIAKEFLQEDPILTEGLNDYEALAKAQIEIGDMTTAEAFHKIFRNRRFNYYATLGLEARVLLYKGDSQRAVTCAKGVIEKTQNNEELKLFEFENLTEIVQKVNYIFYKEVIFGLHNINLSTTWDNFMLSNVLGDVHSVSEKNIRNNIFIDEGENLTAASDYRARQWRTATDFSEQMFSYKYKMNGLSNDVSVKNHQPLIRISEMYYIIAEAYIEQGNSVEAAKAIATIQDARGIPIASSEYAGPDSSLDFLEELLEREYYKEFFGEGQVFFFHKRRNSEQIFKGYGSGKDAMEFTEYVIPLPKSETNV